MSSVRYLYGIHAVQAALRQARHRFFEIYCQDGRDDGRMKGVLQLATERNVPVKRVSASQLAERVGEVIHQGVVAKVEFAPLAKHLDDVLADLKEPPLLLVLDGIQDPHNLGACLRTADGMGVHAVIAPKDKAVGLNATAAKVACGAAETVPYLTVTNLARTLREIKDQGIWIAGTAGEANTDLFGFKHTGPMAWVLGNEGQGMRRLTRELCDELVSIPMFGQVESFNVSVATGMVLSETRRQRFLAG
ncbi:23S rRNA (guanosine(2251)-2'-O)-methyltransferase RlmB [Leeia sp. TBRC 13508]|uniref:23S rRNA (guanosine-2'-O-)-methyltransferase RlmB n=1 Tax=Leeia speluncae TaxID=2884804 RepID=A0ABS8D7M2_9NEIS|nr:23S rRNA (guanosine(2251)-2'-O)-methyltransferase RlmB [Leeia speluncae]MCB6184178.1 23S rRNA (guanosine(2251)-2'-O)-methyltransferase RlmB [Leeia speluncae]